MIVLTASNLKKSFGAYTLFQDVSFDVQENEKIGLIGINGCGKTTLFKMLTGEVKADEGNISVGKYLNIGYVEQHVANDNPQSAYQAVLSVFSHLMLLEEELEQVTQALTLSRSSEAQQKLAAKQGVLSERFEAGGGYTYKSRTRAALMGLGFTEAMLELPVRTLSGGEKAKVLLCRMLLSGSDILLLDEPTNHLDIQAVSWLEDYLISYSGAMIIISHDRYFLDKVTNKTLELENGKLTAFVGNYSTFKEKKQQMDQINRRHYANTMKEVTRIEGIIEQQRRWNREKNIVTAQSKQKQIDRMVKGLEKPVDAPEGLRFCFNTPPPGGNDIVIGRDLCKRFAHKTLFAHVDLDIQKGERVFLLGANGCGKTTLVKMLLGKLACDEGDVRLGTNVYPGYYDQTQSGLSKTKTAFDEISDAYPMLNQTQIRNALAAFLFKGDDAFKTMDLLSGGECARISLLKLMLSKTNLLLLDEPTNHLDITAREALEHALLAYEGTLLVVSHDRYLINRLATRVLYLCEQGIASYIGGYDEYLSHQARQKQQAAPQEKPQKQYHIDKEKKRQFNALKGKCQRTLALAEAQDAQVRQLEEALCTHAEEYQKVLELTAALEQARLDAEQTYDEWLELTQLVEDEEAMMAE